MSVRLRHRDGRGHPGGLWSSLRQHESDRSTGVLVLDAPVPSTIALYRGCPYAVMIEGWNPDVLARLVSAGAVSIEQADVLRTDDPDDSAAQARAAVEAGLIDAEELAVVHQELVLSALGALVDHATPAGFEDGATVDRMCAIPLEIDPLQQTLALRAQRSATTWEALGVRQDPGRATFVCDAAEITDELRIPEVLSVVAEMGSPTSVDEVAGVTGLTRAETLHILAALVQAGVAVYTPTPAPTSPDGVWWTAEQIAS